MSTTPDHEPLDDDLHALGTRLRSDGERRPADLPALGGRIQAGRQRARLAVSATCVLAVLVVATVVGVGASGSTETLQAGDGDSMIGAGTTPGSGPPGSDVPPGSSVTTVTVPVPSEEPTDDARPSTTPVPSGVPATPDVASGSPPDGSAATASDEPPTWPREDVFPVNLEPVETWAINVTYTGGWLPAIAGNGSAAPYDRFVDGPWHLWEGWSDPADYDGTGMRAAFPVVGDPTRFVVYYQGPSARRVAEHVRDEIATWDDVTSAEVGRIDFSLPNACRCEEVYRSLGRVWDPLG